MTKGYRPNRWDIIGALSCLAGVGVITYAPARPDTAQATTVTVGAAILGGSCRQRCRKTRAQLQREYDLT
jgi:hypothetical protein